MGSSLVIPEADEKIAKCTKTFRLTPKEVSDFFMLFMKFDKQKQGLVSLDDIFEHCELSRNDFTVPTRGIYITSQKARTLTYLTFQLTYILTYLHYILTYLH